MSSSQFPEKTQASLLPARISKTEKEAASTIVALMPRENQAEAALQLMRTVTLEEAMQRGMQLKKAVELPELMLGAKNELAAMVNGVCQSFGPSGDMPNDARKELCRSIVEQYGYLNIEEIALALRNGQTGKYGQQFHKLSASAFLGWLNTYSNSDERLGFWERENGTGKEEYIEEYGDEVDSKGKKTGKRIIINRYRAGSNTEQSDDALQFLKMMGARLMSSGRIAFGAPEKEQKPSQLAAVAPGSAEWHRMQADRLEAQEAIKEREFKARKGVGVAVVEQEKAKEAFKEFANLNYYSLLSEAEWQVLEAANSRILTPYEMRVNEQLNLAWEGVLLEWEELQAKNIKDAGEAALS
jgi:hypothetical protein